MHTFKFSGSAAIESYSSNPRFLNAGSDITKLYDSLLLKAVRRVAIVNEQYVAVRDEIETKENSIAVRWSMVTPATVNIINDSTAALTQNSKRLFLKTSLPFAAKLTTWSTAPTTAWDEPNPGTMIIGFEIKLPANKRQVLTVLLVPEKNIKDADANISSLNEWPKEKETTANQKLPK